MFSQTKRFHLKAGERKRVIYRFSNNIPVRFSLRFTPLEHVTLKGKLEVHRSALLIDNKRESYPLEEAMTLETGYWDAFYSVFVTPEVDSTLECRMQGTLQLFWLIVFTLAISLIAFAIVLLTR